MAGISIQLVAAELQRLVVQNKLVTKADFAMATTTAVDAYCRKVTKVQGTYQVLNSVMGHVVQGFSAVWKELGTLSVADKELKNYHQKVNFGFVPADVLSTALADWYEEDKKPTDKEIAKYIAQWILDKVKDDVNLLSMIAEYDPTKLDQFGYSMNGWNKIVELALANTTRPVYKIPVSAITDNNIFDVLQAYERKLPRYIKEKIKDIHLSQNNVERYGINYRDKFSTSPSYDENKKTKSPLGGRALIGHQNLADDVIFCTIDGNMLNLIDVIDNPPKFTDVQVQDYLVKMFMEFWKGYDFLINEAVCVADFSGSTLGLGNAGLMAKYYPNEQLAVA